MPAPRSAPAIPRAWSRRKKLLTDVDFCRRPLCGRRGRRRAGDRHRMGCVPRARSPAPCQDDGGAAAGRSAQRLFARRGGARGAGLCADRQASPGAESEGVSGCLTNAVNPLVEHTWYQQLKRRGRGKRPVTGPTFFALTFVACAFLWGRVGRQDFGRSRILCRSHSSCYGLAADSLP